MDYLARFVSRSSFWIREFGLVEYLKWLRVRILGEKRPTLDILTAETIVAVRTTSEVLRNLGMDSDKAQLDSWISDYVSLRGHVHGGIESGYPTDYDLGRETGALLYSLIRKSRPKIVVETGIARGHSSLAILGALDANGSGKLISLDPDPEAGSLVPARFWGRWERPSFPGRIAKSTFKIIMSENAPIDLFLHDSNHRYGWMIFELTLARQYLRYNGILMADDVQQNRAFFDATIGATRSSLLVDDRKMCGVATFCSG